MVNGAKRDKIWVLQHRIQFQFSGTRGWETDYRAHEAIRGEAIVTTSPAILRSLYLKGRKR